MTRATHSFARAGACAEPGTLLPIQLCFRFRLVAVFFFVTVAPAASVGDVEKATSAIAATAILKKDATGLTKDIRGPT